jgi:hypothetical protein
MSYVITIQRTDHSLSTDEIERAVSEDAEFVAVSTGCWRWAGAPDGSELFLNFGDNNLWTDGGRGWTEPAALEKLRLLAKGLNARVIGEEGEELTENEPAASPPSSATGTFLTLVIMAALVPVIALVALIRLPLVLWRVVRPK